MHPVLQTRIAVVGAGEIGAGFAYALLMSDFNVEIIFVDRTPAKAIETALDLQQAMIFSHPHEIRAGTFAELGQADLIVIAAPAFREGQRAAPVEAETLALLQDVGREVEHANSGVLMLVGAEPNDLLTYAAWKFSGLPRNQVIGTGTMEMSATLRYLLGRHFRVDPRSVHIYVMGGDNGEVPIWSTATIAGMPVTDACKSHGCPPAVLKALFREAQDRVRQTAARRAGQFSAGSALAWLASSVLRNENHIFAVSTVLHHEYGMSDSAFSVPVVIGEKGIDRILHVEVSDEELPDLLASGFRTEEAVRKIGLMEQHPAHASELC
jgi:L-lactate dehydrogenase